jgi:hypothetical protein
VHRPRLSQTPPSSSEMPALSSAGAAAPTFLRFRARPRVKVTSSARLSAGSSSCSAAAEASSLRYESYGRGGR